MRRFLPETLPAWILFIVITGLMVYQVATLAIVSLDRAAANDVLELYRVDERAFSLVQLLSATRKRAHAHRRRTFQLQLRPGAFGNPGGRLPDRGG